MGKYTKKIRAGVMTSEEALKKMAENYNREVPRIAKNWLKVAPEIADRWDKAMEKLIGRPVSDTYKERIRERIEAAKDYFERTIKGKGETLISNMVAKLQEAVTAA